MPDAVVFLSQETPPVEARPPRGTAAEWQARHCSACQHRRGDHYETFDRSRTGCAAMVPAPPFPFGEEPCICKGFDKPDQ
jgi:hypothetical protein